MEKGKLSFKRMYNAGIYSYKGFVAAIRYEASFQQELMSACVLLPLALIVDVSVVERIVLVATVLFVLIVELLNSAVEAVVDRVGDDYHELSGRAKDFGSAAVLLTIILWAFSWGSIFFARFG